MHRRQLELPGEYPYTRGIFPDGYLGRFVGTMRQSLRIGTPEESNQRYTIPPRAGTDRAFGGARIVPIWRNGGYDPVDSMARPEVGKVGVSLFGICARWRFCSRESHLAKISTSFTIKWHRRDHLAMYLATADKAGVPRAKLPGTSRTISLEGFVARGTWIFPVRPSMRLVATRFLYGRSRSTSRFNSHQHCGCAPWRATRLQRRFGGDGVHARQRPCPHVDELLTAAAADL